MIKCFLYNFDEGDDFTPEEQRELTKKAIGKKVEIKYNHAGRDKIFKGIIKEVRRDDFILKQDFQELTLRIPQIISIKVCEG